MTLIKGAPSALSLFHVRSGSTWGNPMRRGYHPHNGRDLRINANPISSASFFSQIADPFGIVSNDITTTDGLGKELFDQFVRYVSGQKKPILLVGEIFTEVRSPYERAGERSCVRVLGMEKSIRKVINEAIMLQDSRARYGMLAIDETLGGEVIIRVDEMRNDGAFRIKVRFMTPEGVEKYRELEREIERLRRETERTMGNPNAARRFIDDRIVSAQKMLLRKKYSEKIAFGRRFMENKTMAYQKSLHLAQESFLSRLEAVKNKKGSAEQ